MTDRAAAEQKTAELVAEYGSADACPGVLLCDRHPGEAVAFTVVEPDLSYRDLTFGELGELSSRFAASLAALGVGPGDAVATLMGKSAELVVALLGIWRLGAVHVPLFTAFAPPAIEFRLARSGAKVVVADEDHRAMRAGDGEPAHVRLRRASSAGEPLTPDIVTWSKAALGTEVRDHYGQTEHGMIIVNGWHDDVRTELRPGSMGQPLPGFSCAVLHDDRDEPAAAGTPGRIAVDMTASPLAHFAGYHGDPDTTGRFTPDGRWWLTGDGGYADADENYFFSARDDDVIIMAGYRIGPFDVESVLVTHDQVIEAAAIGVPDELRGEVIEAFVVLRDSSRGTEELAGELQQLVKDKFAAHAYPRRVHFVEALPKTPSGKVQRYLLRQQRG